MIDRVDFFFTPRKQLSSATTPLKKTGFKRRLLFEGDDEDRCELPLTPVKAKRTYSESTLVQKQISGHSFVFISNLLMSLADNRKYLKIQRKLVEQGVRKDSEMLSIETTPNLENPDMATIEAKTLNRLLEERNDVILIDARFSFEYEGTSLSFNLP